MSVTARLSQPSFRAGFPPKGGHLSGRGKFSPSRPISVFEGVVNYFPEEDHIFLFFVLCLSLCLGPRLYVGRTTLFFFFFLGGAVSKG
jgi:hypothetical protein